MPNKNNYILFLSFLCFNCSFFIQAQTNSSPKEAITNAFERYFEAERENIHVQLDKTIFLTNEDIWFKGYVYNKTLNLPFYATTNVYVQLINESGAIVTNQLLYSMSGLFSGKINLNKEFKSGYYYLQFYTNWMNNFAEDESYIQRIKIKNTDNNTIPLIESINPKKINLEFYPEGGNFITNAANNVGVKITDINGKSIPNCLVEIRDSNNVVQKSVVINSFGVGKFEFVPNKQNYKAVVLYNDSTFEYNLPTPRIDGICLEINNYILENKTLVKIKYNTDYEEVLKNKKLYLVIQKNEKSNIIDVKLDAKNEITTIVFSNDLLFNGVNSIRIIDSEMNEIAHRLLFLSTAKNSKISINTGYRNTDKIELSGNSNWYDACISVATLPSNTKLTSDENIITTLNLNAYLNEKILVKSDYFNEMSRLKKYELDIMMLTQKSNKYEWNRIKRETKISINYPFESGLEIKGTINSTKATVKECRIQLKNILSDVLSSTEDIEKNEFFFKNTTITDSLRVFCNLLDKKDRSKKEMNYHLTITNKNKKFNKTYVPIPYEYNEQKDNYGISEVEIPFFDVENGILLKEVEIKKVKEKLKRKNESVNSYLRGFKVGVDIPERTNVLRFIEQNGFNVTTSGSGSVTITGRVRTSINGVPYPTPIIFIDGIQLMSLDILFGMTMDELDEIYISSTAIVASMNNNQGIIKMYRKQPEFFDIDPNNKPKTLIGGFKMITPFENANYISENTNGFENFGLIYWSPWILTDEKGNLKVVIPNNTRKTVKLLIEGFTLDGVLISEIKEVSLEE